MLQNTSYRKNLSETTPIKTSMIHTLAYASMYLYDYTYKECFKASYHILQKISYGTKMSHSTVPHPHTLHTSSCTPKYDNIYAPYLLDPEIDSFKL